MSKEYARGIDVSMWQKSPDWEVLKSEIDFAIIRAGMGKNIDPEARRNMNECERLNIPFGIYWFSYAVTPEQAEAEGKRAVEFLQGANCIGIFYDWEYDSEANYTQATNHNFPRHTCVSYANRFCKAVEAGGYRAGIYTNHDYYNHMAKAITGDRMLWMSHYRSTEPPEKWDIWQQSTTQVIPGINGPVDYNFCKWEVIDKLYNQRYQKLEDIPETYRGTIKRMIDGGIIAGKETGLDLSEDMCRIVVYVERMLNSGTDRTN